MLRSVLLSATTVAILCSSGTAGATIWRVHPDSVISSIQVGIDSSSSGDTVLVYPDTYVENINFNGKNIVLGSLFLMTRNTTYISSTIIDGDSTGSVVTFNNREDSTALLTGFTMQNGYAEYGGAMYLGYSSPSLTDLIISKNSADYGGGFALDNSSPSLTNVTVSGNSANDGGGFGLVNSSPSLTNVTMNRNTADHGNGGGLHCCAGSSPSLVNCILWNDVPEEIYFFELWPANAITISYSDIQGDSAGIVTNDNGTVYWLEGNIDEDPLFAATGDHPLSLQEGSPCIDAGTPDTVGLNLPPWDILGNYRIWDGDGDQIAIIDMGAYEYGAPHVGIGDEVMAETKIRTSLQNYPNPFGPQTTIQYGMDQESRVSLKLYNLSGQEVRVLVDEHQGVGVQTTIWDGRDDSGKTVSSGVYFLRLQTGGYTVTKKLSVMR